MEATFEATANEWDAPVGIYTHLDGVVTIRRDEEWERDDADRVWGSRVFMPHGLVYVDGEMTAFDRARQPGAGKHRSNGYTLDQFRADYAARSGMLVDFISLYRRFVECDCGDPLCSGWAAIPIDDVQH